MANSSRNSGIPGTSPHGGSDQVRSGQTRLPPQHGTTARLNYDFSGSIDPMRFEFATVKGEPVYYMTAKDILMPDKVKGPANELAREFLNRTGASLTITSGRRDAPRQAKAMYNKFQANVRKEYTAPSAEK